MTTLKRAREEETCADFANKKLKRVVSADSPQKKKQRKSKKHAKASPSNISAVHDGGSPPTVDSKGPYNPLAAVSKRLSFSNDQKGAPESSTVIVTKRLKDLCSMKEPTVNVGIGIVGAAYLLKQMTTKRPDDDHDNDDDKIELAIKQAVEATELLFLAEHNLNNALQQLSETETV